jgi:hypothetical protein
MPLAPVAAITSFIVRRSPFARYCDAKLQKLSGDFSRFRYQMVSNGELRTVNGKPRTVNRLTGSLRWPIVGSGH